MSPAESCPPSLELAHFLLGHADDERIEAIGQHVDNCRRCRARLADLDPNDPLARGLRRPDDPTAVVDASRGSRLAGLVKRLSNELPTGPAGPSGEHPVLQPPDAGTGDLGRLGHYRLLSVLGEGGMGVVYQAVDTRLQRTVALKVLKPFWSRTASARRRFLREARACASLAGEHIVPIFDVGEEAGAPYLAMQLLQGDSLEFWLRRQSPLPTPLLLEVTRQIAEGLALAHERGIVHRDLKPANLWVESHEAGLKVRILDFGLARIADEDVGLTQSGIIVGTPTYMAPEQATGAAVDPRSDLFSLGCIAYRMATGELPFAGKDTLAVIAALALRTPPAPARLNPDLPGELSALILRLLAKNPAQRPASATELLGLLAGMPTRPRRPARLRRAVVVAVLLALALTLVGVFWPRSRDERPDPERPPPVPAAAGRLFDGSSLVRIPNVPLLVEGPYTVEAQVTLTEVIPKHRQILVGFGAGNRWMALEISDWRLPAPTWRYSWQFPNAIGSVRAEPNQSYHLAGVFSGTEASFYVNGKRDATLRPSKARPPESPGALTLGDNVRGRLFMVRLSKGCRYAEDFRPAERFEADPDTLALYLLDDSEGDLVYDRSGNGYHGKIVPAPKKTP